MSYLVLARRWRPQTFDEVVGQRPVTQTLKNALARHRIAHALLFAGPRGVGKTTVARILAKALNCDRGRAPDPCNECTSCREIMEGRSVDCLEIDGASNRGIDEVRELRDTVRYAPSRNRFRVIIIDEVHMLTEPAFNALLKTLEEPPPGVIFVLATTDAHKIPDTILSRCQRHDFRKLGQAEIVGRLGEIARHEQVAISDAALHAIARASDGSLRDAQSLLDQVIAYGGRELGEAEVAAVLGLADSEAVAQAAQAIIDRDGARALALVDAVSANGHDLHRFCQDLLAHVRDLMVARVIEDPAPLVQASRVPLETLRAQARGLSLSELETTFQLLSQAEFEMRRAAHPRFVLEMALIEASAARTRQSLEALLDRLSALEARLLAGGPPAAPSPIGELPLFSATRPASRTERKPPGPTPPIAEAPAVHDPLPAPRGSPQSPLSVEAGWARATRIVERKKRSLAALLAEAKGVQVDEGTLVVTLENGTAFARSTLDDNDNRQLVAAAAAEAFGRPLRVEYRFQAPATPVAPGPAGAAASGTGAPASDPSEAAPRAPVESPSAAPRTLGRRRGASERGPAGKPSEGGTVTPPADPPHEHPLVRRAVELFGGEVIQVRGPRSGTA